MTLNNNAQKFTRKPPRFLAFVKNRFNLHIYSGLFLTVVVIIFIYIFSLLAGLVEDVVTQDQIVRTDMHIANFMVLYRSAELTRVFTWITALGDWPIIVSAAVVISLLSYFRRKRKFIFPFWLTIFGAELFDFLGKIAFHRPRPGQALIAESDYSFPSGHATIAMVFYGFLVYAFFRSSKSIGVKCAGLLVGLALILLIGFSRLYLGVHYLSDVWAGYLLGALWLIAGIALSEWHIIQSRNNII